jgi:uncharacterized protein YdaU (DUF1376 family)
MAELPIMPVLTANLIADTTHMEPDEFGAYCRILFALWVHGGRLPQDTEMLRRIGGVGPKRWARIEKTVLRPLTIADGMVSQKRLTDVMHKVRETRARRSVAGIKGNKARWAKENYFRHLQKSSDGDKPLN